MTSNLNRSFNMVFLRNIIITNSLSHKALHNNCPVFTFMYNHSMVIDKTQVILVMIKLHIHCPVKHAMMANSKVSLNFHHLQVFSAYCCREHTMYTSWESAFIMALILFPLYYIYAYITFTVGLYFTHICMLVWYFNKEFQTCNLISISCIWQILYLTHYHLQRHREHLYRPPLYVCFSWNIQVS